MLLQLGGDMSIVISLLIGLFLALAVRGGASIINSKFGGNIQRKHLQVFMLPLIICVVIFIVPKLMVYFGLNQS